MHHPLLTTLPEYRSRLTVAVGLVTVAISLIMTYVGGGLLTPDGRPGGLSLQLAGDPRVAAWIVSAWTPSQRALAQNLLVLDYTFLVFYSTLLALGCLWAAALWPIKGWGANLGVWLAWASWAAGALDAVENAALLSILRGAPDATVTTLADAFVVNVARMSAAGKWALIEVALIYVAVSVAFDATIGLWVRAVRASIDR